MINDTLKLILKDYLYNKPLSINIDNEKELFNVANALNVSTIVAYKLKEANFKSKYADLCLFKSISNYERLKSAKESIYDVFTDFNINFLLLKGLSIANYYKEPYLRYSSDIDIIINKEHYDKAYDLMINKLGYSCKKNAAHEKTLVNKQGVNVDFHKSFLFEKPEFEDLFSNSFNNEHELDNNYKYVFHLIHGAMHLILGQMELRFFVDLFYLKKNIDIDITRSLVDKLGLSKFENSMNSYLDCLLGLKEYSEMDNKIDDFISNYSNDLGASNRVLNQSNHKFNYFIHHMFPSFNIMKGKYPILEKWPVLLPIMYVKRDVGVLFSSRRKYVLNELKEGIAGNKTSSLLNDLDLNSYITK